MSRSAVKVVLRTRPTNNFAQDQLQINQGSKSVTVVHAGRGAGLPSEKAGPPQQYQFTFDGILHNCSQEDVFELCASDVIEGALEGYNGTILCYGQTGAGKTYTMTGNRQSYRQRGLVPRVISATVSQLSAAPGLSSWGVSISYLEIYNEALYDLLDINTQPHELSLYEDARGQTQVSGLRKVAVGSEAEALALFFEGESNRVIGEHQLNRESSRSHSIFMMHITTAPEGAQGQNMVSKLFLVDLAGSERVTKTRSEGLVLREAGHINKSLHILEQVVLAASQKGRDHVPYRSSKLTHVLKDSLGGNCRTVMIANVWGEVAQLDDTLSTCRFAARMARLVCEVRSNVVTEGGARVRALEREVQELKEELAMMQLIQHYNNSSSSVQDSSSQTPHQPYSDAARLRLRESVLSWLQQPDESADVAATGLAALPLSSVRQLREVLFTVKAIVQQLVERSSDPAASINTAAAAAAGNSWASSCGAGVAAGPAKQSAAAAAAAAAGATSTSGNPGWQECVGDGDDHLRAAAAPDDARPAGYGLQQQQQQEDKTESAGPGPGSMLLQQYSNNNSRDATPHRRPQNSSGDAQLPVGVAPGRAAALEQYRSGPGAERAVLLNDNAARLRAAKKHSKELAVRLNGLKRQLDEAKSQQEQMKQQRQAEGLEAAESLNAEEYQLVVDIREIKAQYRDGHAELQLVRDELQYTAGLLETCKAELLEDFAAWFRKTYGQDLPDSEAPGDGNYLISAACSIASRPESGSSALTSIHMANGEAGTAAGSSRGAATLGSLRGVGQYSNVSSRQTTPPLASLVGALEDVNDPEAAAYYQAQHTGSGSRLAGHRPGSCKKHRGELGTFTSSERSALTDKPRNRVVQ